MEVPGFKLLLQDYCQYCPEFKEYVVTLDVNSLTNEVPMYTHNIECVHKERCARIAENIRKKVIKDAEDK